MGKRLQSATAQPDFQSAAVQLPREGRGGSEAKGRPCPQVLPLGGVILCPEERPSAAKVPALFGPFHSCVSWRNKGFKGRLAHSLSPRALLRTPVSSTS